MHPGYAAVPGAEADEFRTMVAALHAAGIEVIVDVVANHTCEGGVDGPTPGLSRARLARLLPGARPHRLRQHPDAGSPTVVRLVTDALRYWAGELGVDGFRLDLASVLGRPGADDFTRTRRS